MMPRTKTIPAYIGIAALLAAATSHGGTRPPDSIRGGYRWKGRLPPNQAGATRPCEGFTPPPKWL